MAGLPLVVGLTGNAYQDKTAMNSGFQMAMVICAALLAPGAVLSALTIDNDVLRPEPEHSVAQPECLTCLPIGSPPLEPETGSRPRRRATKLDVHRPPGAAGVAPGRHDKEARQC